MNPDRLIELTLLELRGDLSPSQVAELHAALEHNPELREERHPLERVFLGLLFAVPSVEPLPGHHARLLTKLRSLEGKPQRPTPRKPHREHRAFIPRAGRSALPAVWSLFIMTLFSGSVVTLPHLGTPCLLKAMSEGHSALRLPTALSGVKQAVKAVHPTPDLG